MIQQDMIQAIDRQFVRTTRPLYGHLVSFSNRHFARRSSVGIACATRRELAQRLRISRPTSSARHYATRVTWVAAWIRWARLTFRLCRA